MKLDHVLSGLVVDDLDTAVAEAPGEFGEITTVPGFVRTAARPPNPRVVR